ncbi:MAG: CesT family type III secretion system chaperone [Myxococcales bacterium]|nr:CesT family type III secretion system chaperone [Myxococcales bacterium]
MESPNGDPPRIRTEEELAAFGLVDEYIERFGDTVAANLDPLDRDGFTDIRHGAVLIGVNVVPKRGVLLLLVRMGELPAQDEARVYRELLELNFLSTGDCTFAIDDRQGAVYLRAMRRLEGLDYTEFEALLLMIAQVAEDMSSRVKSLLGT